MRKAVAAFTLAAVTSAALLTHASDASAQTAGNVQYVTPTGKGITGCALLGAEAVALVEAAAGVQARWAYIVGPVLGAGAGAAGGYFLEQAGNSGADTTITGLAVGSLVLGLGLVVPTVIAYVNATNYRPESQASEDAAPTNAPIDESAGAPAAGAAPAEGGAPSTAPAAPAGGTGSTAAPSSANGNSSALPPVRTHRAVATARTAPRVTGLLDVTGQGLSLAVPAVSVENSISTQDMRQYGLAPQSELRIPVLSGSF
ncbi:MAG: hypothetical protein U0324_06810 [Polyangiales bacterium]